MAVRESEPLTDESALRAELAALHQRLVACEQQLDFCTHQRDEALCALQDTVQEKERYRLISELLSQYAYVFRIAPDTSPEKEWVSDSFVATTGYTHEEVMALGGWSTFVHPDDAGMVQQRRNRLLGGFPDISEFRIITRAGTVRWIREYVLPEWDEAQNRVVRLYGAAQDITSQRQVEEARRESEKRYRSIITTMRDGVILHDRNGAICEWNDRAKHMLGRTTERLIGKEAIDTSWQAIHEDGTPFAGINHPSLVALRTGLPCSNVVMGIYKPDGALTWVLINAQPLFDDTSPAPDGVVATFTDITQLKHAEEAYRALVEHSLQGFIIVQNQRVIFANPAAAAITGYPIDEMRSLEPDQIKQLLHPAEREYAWKLFADHLAGTVNEPARANIRMVRRDGTIRVLELSIVRTTYHGEPAFQGTFIDITEQVQAVENLRESEERYRTLIETSPSAILYTDLDATIRFCNQQAVRLFRYTLVENLVGKHTADLIAPDYLIADPLLYAHQIAGLGNLRNIEYTMYRNDGSRFVAEVNSSVVSNSQGIPLGMIITVQDISMRKQAERELTRAYTDLAALNEHLRQSRNVLRAVVNGLDDGLALLNPDGVVQMVNQSLAALLGNNPQELVGQPWSALSARLKNEAWGGETGERDWGQGSWKREQHVRYLAPDDTTHILDIKTIALPGPERSVEQIIMHVVDVTENVQLQARVIESERFAASGKLAASVAHEINTPLQSLQNALGLVRRIESASERDLFLVQATREIQRIARIVRQLLDLYRPAAAMPASVDINVLIERLLLLVGKQLRDQRVTVEQHLAPHLPPLRGRPDEIMQVLLNLMVNALDAMAGGGVLKIQTRTVVMHNNQKHAADPAAPVCMTAPAFLEIDISDTGCGINPDLQERIFEPFVTTREQGTGLGLAISSQIVAKHHGHIKVESQPGKGSTFTVVFPLAPRKTSGQHDWIDDSTPLMLKREKES